eukprot:31232-Pelagococcus_subviridis.AAC.17
MPLEREQRLELVRVPVLHRAVLTGAEHVVRLRHERDGRHRVPVREHRLVAVAEIHAPYAYVLVRAPGREQRAVVADVVAQRGETVPVQRQEKLERVDEKNLQGVVQQRHGQELPVLRHAHGEHVLAHLQRSNVRDAELATPRPRAGRDAVAVAAGLSVVVVVDVDETPLPKLDRLVRRAAHEPAAVRERRHAPHRALVRVRRASQPRARLHVHEL